MKRMGTYCLVQLIGMVMNLAQVQIVDILLIRSVLT
jgi:hypothetical protein